MQTRGLVGRERTGEQRVEDFDVNAYLDLDERARRVAGADREATLPAQKDFKLLSFGEEALEEEALLAAAPKAMVSSHDAADGGALLRPDVAPELSEIAAARAAADDDARDADARGWVQALVDDDDDAPPRAARSAPAAPAWF